jgi:predicted translin family RNA/ssDNA-binding protein|tara:strand:- start:2095 stop:2415 length:321 start_codon:yes stop_codon:yes gene_type:complete
MDINPTLFYIIIGILVALLVISSYIINNLLVKVEKYEDITQDQVRYLQNISDTIGESKRHLQNLDDKGVFQSDDEVGEFFNQMKEVQEQLNDYMLPKNYGKEESES